MQLNKTAGGLHMHRSVVAGCPFHSALHLFYVESFLGAGQHAVDQDQAVDDD